MDHQAYQNFRNLVMMRAESRLDLPFTEEIRITIEARLEKMRPLIQTQPDHPNYHWMILNAIRELNGGMGSSEEAISNFMKKKFKNLPWAHSTFLEHYLSMLSENGDLLISHDKLYMEPKDADDKSISSKNQTRKYCKRRLPKNSPVVKVRKHEEDERMDVLEVDKPHRQPITRRRRFVRHNSVTTDVGMLCSYPKPKPMEHEELMVVPHLNIEEGKDLSRPVVQLGRGKRSKRKPSRFLLNLDQKKVEGPTTRLHGRPPSCNHSVGENEALQLVGGETMPTPLSKLLPPKESDVGTRAVRFKPSTWYLRRSKRITEPEPEPEPEPKPEGIIIASPA